jgi:hypothetical protein
MAETFVTKTAHTNSVDAIRATNGVNEWLHCSIGLAVDVDAQVRPRIQQVVE